MTIKIDTEHALHQLHGKAQELGFDKLGILDVTQPHPALENAGQYLQNWLAKDYHGSMAYMNQHGAKRWRPNLLIPGTTRVLALRMHYLEYSSQAQTTLDAADQAYISRYALGRDYHKTMRKRLQQLVSWMTTQLVPLYSTADFQARAFVDSAPVMEKATAQAAGLGWIGKNTLVIDSKAGSWFFLGEIYTNLPLPATPIQDAKNHCGSCNRCIEICPTQAIIGPYTLDARRCISYLTIENKDAIPLEFRKAIGNRIFGCDDCQLACPWNRFAKLNVEHDFKVRHNLDQLTIDQGLKWSEADFDNNTQGSPIRRAGYQGWLRNLAVAAGNALTPTLVHTLVELRHRLQQQPGQLTLSNVSMILEHIDWALNQDQTHA